MKLLNVDSLSEARKKLVLAVSDKKPETEYIHRQQALGRILSMDIISPEPIPNFRRSTVDGYAVCAQDTQGVSESLPVFLKETGQVQMGKPTQMEIKAGHCAYVPTGGMIPKGADAMVMVEYCETVHKGEIAVYDSVSPGRNIVAIGEDTEKGQLLLKKGTFLRPQEIGALAAVGIEKISVYKPWNVTILSTGDELAACGQTPLPGQIRDINTYALEALCFRCGFIVIHKEVLADKENIIEAAVQEGKKNSDLVVVSGGSSQGDKDYTAKILNELASSGVFTHGIAMKPGKPTILAYDETTKTILMGLPGHPAAAILVFQLLATWVYRHLTRQQEPKKIRAVLNNNAPGAAGRETCLLVKLEETPKQYNAQPILGKSGLITTLTRADGYVTIPMNHEGLKEGETVEVTLF